MMGAAFPVPRSAPRASRDEGLARYLRLEFRDGDTSWNRVTMARTGRLTGRVPPSVAPAARGIRGFVAKVAALFLI